MAKALKVEPSQVIQWARDGLYDADHSIALVNFANLDGKGRGQRRRCTILLPGEIDRLIGLLGGKPEAARWLGISVPILRRYRCGTTAPPHEMADRILQALKEPDGLPQCPMRDAANRGHAFEQLARNLGGMKAMAMALGISRSCLYRYVRGERQLPRALADSIHEKLAGLVAEPHAPEDLPKTG